MVLLTDKSDNELAVLAASGDEPAFREILNRFRSKLIGICMRMLKNKTEAEEAAQDSFVKVYTHLNDFDPERNFAAWIAGITINECRDRLRKRTRFKKTFVETSDLISQSAAAPDKVDLENKARLDAVEEFKAKPHLKSELREVLKDISDIERLIGRICTSSARPRDLGALRDSSSLVTEIKNSLNGADTDILKQIGAGIDDLSDIRQIIDDSLVDEPPVSSRDGGIIKEGVNAELDELRSIRCDGKKWIAELEGREKKERQR